jgi:hypothetical protein
MHGEREAGGWIIPNQIDPDSVLVRLCGGRQATRLVEFRDPFKSQRLEYT